jgi:hypothetical protein
VSDILVSIVGAKVPARAEAVNDGAPAASLAPLRRACRSVAVVGGMLI